MHVYKCIVTLWFTPKICEKVLKRVFFSWLFLFRATKVWSQLYLVRLRLILHGSSSMYFFSSKMRLMMGFSTSCKYNMPTAWKNNTKFLYGRWLTQIQWDQHVDQKDRKIMSVSANLIISLTFMNCSMALEERELDRNKVLGSALRAGAEKRKRQWLTLTCIQRTQ